MGTQTLPARKLQEGEHLGDYAILRQLGQGALGAVFLAEHRFLKKPFVLKILDKEFCQNPDFLSRFEKEVAILAALDHPSIVKVHNVSEAEGEYFLVTDAILDEKGEMLNLYDYLKERGGRLPEEEVVQIALQIAAALTYAHEKGPVDDFAHRSLKPSNILIIKKRGSVQIKISDFGLSRILGSSPYMSRIYQAVADKVGQPAETLPKRQLSFLHHYLFLAPEQRWQTTSPGAKSDIYAFGILLYFILTGKYPEGVFEPISLLAPQYKLPWDFSIHKCLAIEPAKRPENLTNLLSELSGKVSQEVIAAPTQAPAFKPVLNPVEIKRPEYEADPGAIFQVEKVVVPYKKDPEIKEEIKPILTEMTIIPGGSFERGSNKGGRDEMPRHPITLDPYAIDIHPVTNEQFAGFLEEMGGEKDHSNNDIIRLRESRIKRQSSRIVVESGYSKHPVVGVTWYGASAYAKWVGKRLPTEAEWEVAACGGQIESIYPTGKDVDRTHANFFSSDTTPVMSYPANGHGLYDMAGNVYEWCYDWYDYHYYNLSLQEPHNPKGPLQGVYRVLRGGCWKSLKEDLRTSHRHRNNPGTMNGTYGFRLAADVAGET